MPHQKRPETPDAPQGQSVYQRLLDEIRLCKLLPGARLRETELAERLGISRTPVREAIRQLEADGLVIHIPRIGATIRTLDYAEVMELYEMRAVLEGTAARMAARAASDIEIAELESLNSEMAQTLVPDRIYALNKMFHLTLLDAAKNRFLVKSINALQKTLLILGPSTLAESERAQLALGEHERVLDALRARDGAAAEVAMRDHIQAAHRVRLRHLRERERSVTED